MKIFRLCPSTLGDHLRKFRKKFVDPELSFEGQIKVYQQYNIMLPGSWASEMTKLGYEVFETIYNDITVQLLWAFENSDSAELLSSPDPFWHIFKKQLEKEKPDILYIYAGANLFLEPPQRKFITEELGIKIANLWGDELPKHLSYDSLFARSLINHTSSDEYCKTMKIHGISSIMLGNCFEPQIATFADKGKKRHALTFCGVTGFGFADHVGRYQRLTKIMANTDLKIWTSEPRLSRKLVFNKLLLNSISTLPTPIIDKIGNSRWLPGRLYNYFRFGQLQRVAGRSYLSFYAVDSQKPFVLDKRLKSLYRARVKSSLVNPQDYFQLLADSKFVLNLHRDEVADIANIRVYEAAGIGSLLVTDKKKYLSHIFDVENDLLAFDELDELYEKYNYLSTKPELVEEMAKRGQQKILAAHTTKHRCEQIHSDIVRALKTVPSKKSKTLLATYNLDSRPLSYDFAFFIQSALIQKQSLGANHLTIELVLPTSLSNIEGFSEEANEAVDTFSKEFRVNHILKQLPNNFKIDEFRCVQQNSVANGGFDFYFPDQSEHHNAYYRMVNGHPNPLDDLSSTPHAKRILDLFTSHIGRPIVTITLRKYAFDVERNSNVAAWSDFADRIAGKFDVVIVPDSDSPTRESYGTVKRGEETRQAFASHTFMPEVCFDFDLRLALYEKAHINMFVNNGPCVAASLDKRVKFLMFKMICPSVPHCTEEFLINAGYEIGKNPKYLGEGQVYTWCDDNLDEIIAAFDKYEAT